MYRYRVDVKIEEAYPAAVIRGLRDYKMATALYGIHSGSACDDCNDTHTVNTVHWPHCVLRGTFKPKSCRTAGRVFLSDYRAGRYLSGDNPDPDTFP